MQVSEGLQQGTGLEVATFAGEISSTAGVLQEARALLGSRQYTKAIELLTAQNRRHRCREIDSLLVAVRSEAALESEWQTERPPWPSHVADQFNTDGLPEISGGALNATAVRSGIESRGSLIVRNLITPQQVDLLRDNIDRVLVAFDAVESGMVPAELDGWYEHFHRDVLSDRKKKRAKGAVLTVESPPTLFDLLETFENCGLSAVIREFFGEPPMLLSRKGTLRRVQPEGNTGGWHQDGGFLGEDIRSLNVWIALTDCGIDAPGMDIVAKRLPGIVQMGSNYATWATNPQAAKEVSEGCTVRPVFGPGDAIIFDHLCLHRTARKPGMTKTRYAIETWLMAPSTYEKGMGVPILF